MVPRERLVRVVPGLVVDVRRVVLTRISCPFVQAHLLLMAGDLGLVGGDQPLVLEEVGLVLVQIRLDTSERREHPPVLDTPRAVVL